MTDKSAPISNMDNPSENIQSMISEEEARTIAQEDAQKVYRDVSIYEVEAILEGENWKIDYELIDKEVNGGGPHYIISGLNGEILEKRYEQ